MDVVITQLPETVADERGTFQPLAMARERNDGRWEGWLEFVPRAKDSCRYATPIETRQHDRVTMERWASGLTAVYAEGALARARTPLATTTESDQLRALLELIEALDRRVPHVERAGEAKIADDARRLRVAAGERIAVLRDRNAAWCGCSTAEGTNTTNTANRTAISGWEDEGGARRPDEPTAGS